MGKDMPGIKALWPSVKKAPNVADRRGPLANPPQIRNMQGVMPTIIKPISSLPKDNSFVCLIGKSREIEIAWYDSVWNIRNIPGGAVRIREAYLYPEKPVNFKEY